MGASSKLKVTQTIRFGCIFTFIIVAIGALGRFIYEPQDRKRCSSLLNKGWWMDNSYKSWQPASCMMHFYKTEEISTCLGHSRILYVGDSIARQQFFAALRLVRPMWILQGKLMRTESLFLAKRT
ncbi:unnamed protein product [Mucor hiemalis]